MGDNANQPQHLLPPQSWWEPLNAEQWRYRPPANGLGSCTQGNWRIVPTVWWRHPTWWRASPNRFRPCPTVRLSAAAGSGTGLAEGPADHAPHCGNSSIERADKTLQALHKVWKQAADAPHGGPLHPWRRSPQDLASVFLKHLQSQPSLIGFGIHRRWIQGCYRHFCEAEGVTWPPPYKDFARELARLMLRKRIEKWQDGQRLSTATYYCVQERFAAVAELDHKRRMSA